MKLSILLHCAYKFRCLTRRIQAKLVGQGQLFTVLRLGVRVIDYGSFTTLSGRLSWTAWDYHITQELSNQCGYLRRSRRIAVDDESAAKVAVI